MWTLNCKKCGKKHEYVRKYGYIRALKGTRLCSVCVGKSSKGRKMTAEQIQKSADKRRGVKRTEEQRKRISEATKKAMANSDVRKRVLESYTKENRKKRSASMSKVMQKKLDTEEKRLRWSEKISKGTKMKWDGRDDENKKEILRRLEAAREKFRLKMEDEQYKKQHVQKCLSSVKTKDTKPERIVNDILKRNNISFKHPYQIDTKIFDFFIPKKNLLIEVDGVYWHGRGLSYEKMNDMQKKHKKNDEYKNELAESTNHKLIRVWEDEINEKNLIERISKI